ncbi:MAG TPA: Sec-independent protein translocase protein TatB [Pseudolabrys sp.]|nr:Sec-independent protein translocase protein TatB [Pseudolabrys sp.]
MFDIGWGELVVIGIVALIAIGPKELPAVLRTLGQYMAKVRRMAAEFQGQFQDAMREAELAELRKQADEIKSSVSDLTKFDPLQDTQKQIERAFETEPAELAAPEPDTSIREPNVAELEPAKTVAAGAEISIPPEPAAAGEQGPNVDLPALKEAGSKG